MTTRNNRTFIWALALSLTLACTSSFATKNMLDLEGDGKITQVTLPFTYCPLKANDRHVPITELQYSVRTIADAQNDVLCLGPLSPCIGIVVTDGIKIVAFHKHAINSLAAIENVLKSHLDFSQPEKINARIFTTRDDIEWKKRDGAESHQGRDHTAEVKHIKNSLESLNIERARIPAFLYNLLKNETEFLYPKDTLGRYRWVECWIAVRLNDLWTENPATRAPMVKFFSIDPCVSDIFHLHGKDVDVPTPGKTINVPYSLIPMLHKTTTGKSDGYKLQRGVVGDRMKKRTTATTDKLVANWNKKKMEQTEASASNMEDFLLLAIEMPLSPGYGEVDFLQVS